MTRLFIGIFFGDFKGWKIVKKWQPEGHDHHHHEEPGPSMKGPVPHESPWQMWVPLAVLGALSIVAGLVNAHLLHFHVFDSFLEPVFKTAAGVVKKAEHAEAPFIAAAVAAFAAGAGGAYWVYVAQRGEPARAFTEGSPGLYALVRDKWRIDELYEETVIGAVDSLAEFAKSFDKWVVDGVIARLSAFLVSLAGTLLRFLQTGKVQAYAFSMVVGLLGVGWFFFSAQARASVTSDVATGSYKVTAAPGPGYSYRWDANGDGKWDDKEKFTGKREVALELAVDQTRDVRFEVRNAFGLTAVGTVSLVRPRPDLSGADAEAMRNAAQAAPAGNQPNRPAGSAAPRHP
jgi:NADH-quinone oxidoreductase subunit L